MRQNQPDPVEEISLLMFHTPIRQSGASPARKVPLHSSCHVLYSAGISFANNQHLTMDYSRLYTPHAYAKNSLAPLLPSYISEEQYRADPEVF